MPYIKAPSIWKMFSNDMPFSTQKNTNEKIATVTFMSVKG